MGSLAGGPVFEYYGAVYTFRGCAGLSIVTLILYMIAVIFMKKRGYDRGYVEGNGCLPFQLLPCFAKSDSMSFLRYELIRTYQWAKMI